MMRIASKTNRRILGVGALVTGICLAMTVTLLTGKATAGLDLRNPSSYVDADLIRVGISNDTMTSWEYPQTQLSANGPYMVRDKSTGQVIMKGKAGDVVTISVNRAGFDLRSGALLTPPVVQPGNADLGDAPTPFNLPVDGQSPVLGKQPTAQKPSTMLLSVPGPLLIEPLNPPDSDAIRLRVVNITRRKEVPEFRGKIEITRGMSSPNRLTVVNVLPLEDYLKAVVPNELPMRYGVEAVKAQAIAARNYAIRPREKPWRTFDICDSQLCQVYFGSQTETPTSNKVIADTEGLVGIYNGDPILALFSSSHGGYAEAYSNAFSDPYTKQYPAPPIAYLQGGPDMPMPGLDLKMEDEARKFWTDPNVQSYDVESPYYRWEKRWTRGELEAAINSGLATVSKDGSTRDFVSPLLAPGETIGSLKAIRVLERGKSGKAMVVAITGTRGTWTVKKEFLIRKVFSNNGKMLPSGNVIFTPLKDGGLIANGGGFGHGVGLSQLGASWMSKHGYEFPQIIQHYYKGVSLGSIPVAVGPGRPNQPVLTRFDVRQPKGMLWVQDGDGTAPPYNKPVSLQINGKPVTVSTSGFRSGIEIDKQLRPGVLNTLVLFPDEKHPERKLKAWIDLYPPKGSDAVQVGKATD